MGTQEGQIRNNKTEETKLNTNMRRGTAKTGSSTPTKGIKNMETHDRLGETKDETQGEERGEHRVRL